MEEHETQPDAAPEARGEVALPEVTSLVATCISLLAGKAWETMGLVPDPTTRKIESKLDDAQLAIDAVAALADLVRPRLSEAERREVEVLVTNLRLNFVEQRSKQP
ncbi:MAG: DUF1844 domain-containing protein [Armatimonadota bacterium]